MLARRCGKWGEEGGAVFFLNRYVNNAIRTSTIYGLFYLMLIGTRCVQCIVSVAFIEGCELMKTPFLFKRVVQMELPMHNGMQNTNTAIEKIYKRQQGI